VYYFTIVLLEVEMSDREDKLVRVRIAGAFDVQLVGIGSRLSLQDLIDFSKDMFLDVPLSEIIIGLSPNDLGVRLERYDPLKDVRLW
jgi:hypothetical protein